MPNPGGTNSFNRFGGEAKYGDAKKHAGFARAAPISGAPTAAINAPRRLQKQAARGQSAGQGEAPAAPPPPVETPYPTQLASVWSELAASAPDDDLIGYYAATAQRQALG